MPNSHWAGFDDVKIIRGDLIHPHLSGNKLYKLLPTIELIRQAEISHLISVGGRHSNHLHALAWLGKHFSIPTVALVMGHPGQGETATLSDCREWGMTIHYVDRVTFQHRYQSEFWQPWREQFPQAHIIFEGGWAPESLDSAKLWWQSIPQQTDIVICPVGSGTTLAGLVKTRLTNCQVIGVPVFRDPNQYQQLKEKLQLAGVKTADIKLWQGFAGRGFGRLTTEERSFMQRFEAEQDVMLDPVYTVKTFYALERMLNECPVLKGKKIAVLHTGGLQGRRS